MKKLLLYTSTCLVTVVSNADALPSADCCDCHIQIGESVTYSPLCTDDSFCQGCNGTIDSSIVNGVCVPTCIPNIIGPINPRCSQNQYGTKLLCNDCPDGGTTKYASGGSAITDCYLPKGTTLADASGTYIYTDDCFYSLGS